MTNLPLEIIFNVGSGFANDNSWKPSMGNWHIDRLNVDSDWNIQPLPNR